MLPALLDSYKNSSKKTNPWLVPVGVSNRHVHLSQRDLEQLFGPGYRLTVAKKLSQIGQFAAQETIKVVGTKGILEKVRVLGPVREETQIELSRTDCVTTGIEPIIRDSGDLMDTAGAILVGPRGPLNLEKGCIVPRAHIHLDPQRAAQLELKDKDKTCVFVQGNRVICYQNVLVRVSKNATTEFHIDTDEANAAFVNSGDMAMILGRKAIIKDNSGNVTEINIEKAILYTICNYLAYYYLALYYFAESNSNYLGLPKGRR